MSGNFNWKRMCSDGSSFEGLRQELASCGGRYCLDAVTLPGTCEDAICDIEFRCFRNGNIVLLYSSQPFRYSGRDPVIAEWVEKRSIEFQDFNELTGFLLRFKADAVDTDTTNCGETPPPKPVIQYNKDNISVPITSQKYCVLDKEKLIAYVGSEILGQEANVRKLVHLVCNHLATKHKARPLSVFIYGPTGVGKSAVVEQIVNGINKQVKPANKYAYRPVDCTQFQERYDVSRLIGAAPGYVGHDEPGVFSILEENPRTVFVFEEIEKAAPNVTEVIMQALETGRQDTNGKTLSNGKQYFDLSEAVIFFTSNIELNDRKPNLGFSDPGSDDPAPVAGTEEISIAKQISRETKDAKEKLAATGKFRREVIGRMNAVMKFDQIPDAAIVDIAAKCIADVAEQEHLLYIVELRDDVLQAFLNETADEVKQFGVRALRSEAQYYFSDVFREFSHTHADYTHITVTGTLDDIQVASAYENKTLK